MPRCGLHGDWDAYLEAESGLPGPRANLEVVDGITASLGAEHDRRADDFKVLRQALAYW